MLVLTQYRSRGTSTHFLEEKRMKVIRVLGLLLLGLVCSFLLVLAPDLGSGLKAYGTNVTWLSVCSLMGVGWVISMLFDQPFLKRWVSRLHFSPAFVVAIIAAMSIAMLFGGVSILVFDSYGPAPVTNEEITRLVGLLTFAIAVAAIHTWVVPFRYGGKAPLRGAAA